MRKISREYLYYYLKITGSHKNELFNNRYYVEERLIFKYTNVL